MKHILITIIAAVVLNLHTAFAGPIHMAAAAGNENKVKNLINSGVSVNQIDIFFFNWTPLHHAAYWGEISVVKLLIDKGANVDAKAKQGSTPLMVALENGKTEVAKMLIEYNADIEAVKNDGYSPLHAAVYYPDIVEILVNEGLDVNVKTNQGDTPLDLANASGLTDSAIILRENGGVTSGNREIDIHDAAGKGDIEGVQQAINNGVDVNAVSEEFPRTPLQYAVQSQVTDLVNLLIKAGAKVNTKDENGRTPLHLAAEGQNGDIVLVLLKNSANVNEPDNLGLTPLHMAPEVGITKLLIENGANVNARSVHGDTPSDFYRGNTEVSKLLRENGGKTSEELDGKPLPFEAIRDGNIEKVEKAIAEGANINGAVEGFLPLNAAIIFQQVEIVKILLNNDADANWGNGEPLIKAIGLSTPLFDSIDHALIITKLLIDNGAKVNTKNEYGETPLYGARKEIAELLVNNGADVNTKDKMGRTPLLSLMEDRYRASKEIIEIAVLLINNGVDVNTKDENGRTLLHVAVSNDDVDIVKFLMEAKADSGAKDINGFVPADLAQDFLVLSVLGRDVEGKLLAESKLRKAINDGDYETTKKLLEDGVNPSTSLLDQLEPTKNTVADLACDKQNRELYNLIKRFGGRHGEIEYAVNYGNAKDVEDFIKTGANVNEKVIIRTATDFGFSEIHHQNYIHIAIIQRDLEKVKILIKNGASLDAISTWDQNRSARELAVKYGLTTFINNVLDSSINENEIKPTTLEIKRVQTGDGISIQLRTYAQNGITYAIESSSNGRSWSILRWYDGEDDYYKHTLQNDNNSEDLQYFLQNNQEFYRVKIISHF